MASNTQNENRLSALLLSLAVGMIVFTVWRGEVQAEFQRPDGAVEFSRRMFALDSSGVRIGAPDARVRIVEVGDFTCGACRELFAAIDTVMHRFPEHLSLTWINSAPQQAGARALSRDLAMAAECAAAQDAFEGFYRTFFQRESPIISRSDLLLTAQRFGLRDTIEFRYCLENRLPGQKLTWQAQQASLLGLTGTPTWFLNGRQYLGAPTAVQLEELVIAALRSPSWGLSRQAATMTGYIGRSCHRLSL